VLKNRFLRIFNLQLEDFILTLKKLLLFTAVLVLSLFTQVQAADVNTVKAAIVKYSVEMGVDPAITLSIAQVESGYNHNLKSPYGAVGVFQLLPSTARRMGLNPYSLDDNIKGGIMYYKSMYKMFGSMQLAVAAYNAGPENVKKYNAVPPYTETKKFVSAIMSAYYYLKAHTDPAVVAYYSQQKAAQENKNRANAPQAQLKNESKAETNTKVIAESTVKAPIPVISDLKSNKDLNGMIKGAPLEGDLKFNSVEM
jgi:opacity protein-like surface antigen